MDNISQVVWIGLQKESTTVPNIHPCLRFFRNCFRNFLTPWGFVELIVGRFNVLRRCLRWLYLILLCQKVWKEGFARFTLPYQTNFHTLKLCHFSFFSVFVIKFIINKNKRLLQNNQKRVFLLLRQTSKTKNVTQNY